MGNITTMSSDKPKVQGTVKWFSNKKGYGFITPAEGSPTDEDVFVHQSSITSEGYRTLDEGWVVEFTIGDDDGGRIKAENVTGPGGGPCTGPRKYRERRPRSEDGGGRGGRGGGRGGRGGYPSYRDNRKPRVSEPHWHADLSDNVKSGLEKKGIRAATGTIDVSLGSARVKLGTGGYSSVAHAEGILAEGTFECDNNGNTTMVWERCIVFEDGTWKLVDSDPRLATSLSLTDDEVGPVSPDETASSLWGDGPSEPRGALEEHDFKMRRVVLTPRKI